jgi:phosphate:Na+ symporter
MLKLERKFDKKLSFSKKSMEEIAPYMHTVSEFLRFVKEHVGKKLNQEDLEIAMLFEKQVNKGRASLKKSAQKRLQDGAEVKGEILYIDMVEHIEKIGDYLLDVAECLRQL